MRKIPFELKIKGRTARIKAPVLAQFLDHSLLPGGWDTVIGET